NSAAIRRPAGCYVSVGSCQPFDGAVSMTSSYLLMKGRAMQAGIRRSCGQGSFIEQLENRVLLTSYTFTQLASFSSAIGTIPVGPLVQDPEGDILGTCQNGGAFGSNGSIFEWHPSTGQLTNLVSFAGTNGLQPTGLTIDSSGNLYGEAVGGTDNDGEIF